MDKVRLVIHPTVDGILQSYCGDTYDSLKEGDTSSVNVMRYNEDTQEYYNASFDDMKRDIKMKGHWGFCNEKEEIHIWATPETSKRDKLRLIAHEIGHTTRPFHKDIQLEETKAERYAEVAAKAYDLLEQLDGYNK